MRLCGMMVEAGQAYSSANQVFLSGLAELFVDHKKDTVVMVRSSMGRAYLIVLCRTKAEPH